VNAGDLAAAAAERAAQARSAGTGEPLDGARPSWACAAGGCPLPGAISGSCFLHFGLGNAHAPRVSTWLRNRPAVVEALRIHDGATPYQLELVGRRLAAVGLPDWAPRKVTLEHEGYGHHGEGLKVDADERSSPKLWRQRIRGLVDAEIVAMLKQRDLAA
jgi:hypothetical protein